MMTEKMTEEKMTTEQGEKEGAKMIRRKQGVVVSAAQPKTLIVAVDAVKTHPLYRKKYQVTKRYAVHYEEGEYAEGDLVEFEEMKPISKSKRFLVVSKLAEKKLEDKVAE
jgi:small subunit ribosomal protein S17